MKTLYESLAAYINQHRYKKGRFVGDAPADPHKRGKTHFRLVQSSPMRISVLFHFTYIVTCTADAPNTLVLDSGGWHMSTMTREAFYELCGAYGTAPLRGVPKLDLRTPRMPTPRPRGSETEFLGHAWRDGCTVTLDENRQWVPTGLAKLTKYAADREARLTVRRDPSYVELKQFWPVLFGCAQRDGIYRRRSSVTLDDVQDRDMWPEIVQRARQEFKSDFTKAWAWIDQQLVKDLVVEVEV